MNINKIIKEEYNQLIKENNDNYQYFSISNDYDNEDFEDMDLDEYDLFDQANAIAKNSNLNILRDKELTGIIINLDNNQVVGGLWITTDNDEFSFDIAIDEKHRNKKLSYILIDEAMSEYNISNDSYSDYKGKNLPMKVDVVNPILANVLKNKYGFKVKKKISNDRVIMSK